MSPDVLLQYLPPFTGRREVFKVHQSVPDIIKEICQAHDRYKKHYNLIYPYFVGNGVKGTARNVWNFLKQHSDYVIEPDSLQTIKTPAAILATSPKKRGGNDCKNLALFSAGIMDAYRRATGKDFDIAFRFAGYNGNDIGHVFVVVKDKGKEIWIDPVLNEFNDREHEPTKYKDKKIEKMALVGLSGVNPYENDKNYFVNEANPVPGQYLAGPKLEKLTKGIESLTSPIQAGTSLVAALVGLFASKPNPNDWKGWAALDQQYQAPKGYNAQSWVLQDGDSVQNEALNIVQWVKNYGIDTVVNDNWAIKKNFGRNVTLEDLADKLRRGGFPAEADQFLAASRPAGLFQPGAGTKQAGINVLLTVGLIGAAAFFLFKKK